MMVIGLAHKCLLMDFKRNYCIDKIIFIESNELSISILKQGFKDYLCLLLLLKLDLSDAIMDILFFWNDFNWCRW